jgi:hypothetical protein
MALLREEVFPHPLEGRHEPRSVSSLPIPPAPGRSDGRGARDSELPPNGPVLLVVGALAGARSINETMIEAFGEIGPAVLHISGERDYWSLKARVRRGDYRLIPSTERIGAAYSAADLVVTRAGSSVWELAAAGKPAILVPYPFATADHQALNAEYFVKAGRAMMIRDLDLDDVPDRVRSLLDDATRLAAMGAARLRGSRTPGRDRRGLTPLPAGGRRLWFIGIGGAASPRPAHRAIAGRRSAAGTASGRRTSSRSTASARISPNDRAGWLESVVSSAYPDVAGTSRADLLAELVGLRGSIVVAGTHGKGTTAAMIAFAIRETGGDPAWLIGAPVPQLGSNAGAGEGWLVVEGDESDRTVFGLPTEIAVVTNVELDHHKRVRLAHRARGGVRALDRGSVPHGAGRSSLRRPARAAG